jgi:DNA-binding NtrC family response regulator
VRVVAPLNTALTVLRHLPSKRYLAASIRELSFGRGGNVSPSSGPLVVVVESCAEIATILCTVLHEEGVRAVVERHEDLAQAGHLRRLIETRQPRLFLWDVPPPLDEHWKLLHRVRRAAPRVGFVVTSTNGRRLERLGLPPDVELVDKPFDLDDVLRAIRRGLESHPAARPLSELRALA